DGAEAARIEAVDLAADRGLGDCAGEGLGRGGAAARIDVVADPGDPGACRLGRCGRRGAGDGIDGSGEHGSANDDLVHDFPPTSEGEKIIICWARKLHDFLSAPEALLYEALRT